MIDIYRIIDRLKADVLILKFGMFIIFILLLLQ